MSPKFSTLYPTALLSTLLLRMACRSLEASPSFESPTSDVSFYLICPNLFLLLLRRYDPVFPLLYVPLDLQCYPAPVVADGTDSELPTVAIGLLLVWLSNSAIFIVSQC